VTSSPLPGGATCASWQTGGASGWLNSPWETNTQAVWDSTGLYGNVTDNSTSGQVGVYYQLPANGPYELLFTSNGVDSYTVTQGTNPPSTGALGDAVPSLSNGAYLVTESFVELRWQANNPATSANTTAFLSFCAAANLPTLTPTSSVTLLPTSTVTLTPSITDTPTTTFTPSDTPTTTLTPSITTTPTMTATSLPSCGAVDPTTPTLGTDLALNKAATQSSDLAGWSISHVNACLAVDGNTDGNFYNGSVTYTNADPNAWWQVDLAGDYPIGNINVWNRTDSDANQSTNFYVLISDNPFTSTDLATTLNQPGVSAYYTVGAIGIPTAQSINRTGRYVRIQLNTTNYLHLAEVQVLYGPVFPGCGVVDPSIPAIGTDLALNKAATQSSDLAGWSTSHVNACLAVDGNTDGNFYNGSVTYTNADPNAWWQVDLAGDYPIGNINVWNRTDSDANQSTNFYVLISDNPFISTDLATTLNQPGVSAYYTPDMIGVPTKQFINRTGRYVRIQLNTTNYLHLAEVQVLYRPLSVPACGVVDTSTPVNGTNLAFNKLATQSSNLPGWAISHVNACLAVDGNTDGNFYDGSVTHTFADPNAWWQVDLAADYPIGTINIWNRTDGGSGRLNKLYFFF
jgi:hypothetical protein